MWGRFWLHGGGIRHPLLNHLVDTYQEPDRKFDPERPRRFEVEGQLDFCSLLDRQIGWFLALENAPGIDANLARPIAEAAAIAHQATGHGELTERVDRGQLIAGRVCLHPSSTDARSCWWTYGLRSPQVACPLRFVFKKTLLSPSAPGAPR